MIRGTLVTLIMKLEIKNIHASINSQEILKGINLELKQGEVHALMGPNGSGKSTLANVLMGNPKYTVDNGSIILDGKDITSMQPDERARLGLFLSFQYPSEVSGVTLSSFLRTAYNSINKEKMDVLKFHTLLKQKMEESRIKMRQIREDILKKVQNEVREKKAAEDDLFRAKEELQKIIDNFNKKIDDLFTKKEQELTTS